MIDWLIILAWYATGAASFCYWWSRDYVLGRDHVPLILCAALMGPVAFLLGAIIHGRRKPVRPKLDKAEVRRKAKDAW